MKRIKKTNATLTNNQLEKTAGGSFSASAAISAALRLRLASLPLTRLGNVGMTCGSYNDIPG